MADLNVNSIGDASGGNTATINTFTPTVSNMAGRNRIINGDFQIDQRGYSGTTGSTGTKYTVDRWTNYFASTITKSKEIIDSRNRGILNINSPTSFGDISQRVEDNDAFSGQTMSLSFWAKSISGSTSAKFQIGNNVDAGLVNQNFTLTTSWQKFEFSFDVPTFSNLAGTTFSYVSFESNSANINWSISEVQLEAGSVATPFEHRHYGQELALCQRYYEEFNAPGADLFLYPIYTGDANGYRRLAIFYKVNKRAVPTVTPTWYLNPGASRGVNGVTTDMCDIYVNGAGASEYAALYKLTLSAEL